MATRRLATTRVCARPGCDTVFHPIDRHSKYCSRDCSLTATFGKGLRDTEAAGSRYSDSLLAEGFTLSCDDPLFADSVRLATESEATDGR